MQLTRSSVFCWCWCQDNFSFHNGIYCCVSLGIRSDSCVSNFSATIVSFRIRMPIFCASQWCSIWWMSPKWCTWMGWFECRLSARPFNDLKMQTRKVFKIGLSVEGRNAVQWTSCSLINVWLSREAALQYIVLSFLGFWCCFGPLQVHVGMIDCPPLKTKGPFLGRMMRFRKETLKFFVQLRCFLRKNTTKSLFPIHQECCFTSRLRVETAQESYCT